VAKLTKEDILKTIEVYESAGSKRQAAKLLGIDRHTLRRRLEAAEDIGISVGLSFPELPSDTMSEEDLLEKRKKQFLLKKEAEESRKLIPIKVTIDGPIGILFFGDPHLDDDGTDIISLEKHANLVRNNEALYGACPGDFNNNWVGRLARLWDQQSINAKESLMLTHWITSLVKNWMFIISGNHDCWLGQHDPIRWIAAQSGIIREDYGVRISLNFPNEKQIRINARHDFNGQSQWNPAHAIMKAAQMGFKDHILVGAHRHISGYGKVLCPSSGIISHCCQVSSYKIYDNFKKERNFPDHHISPCALFIINPYAKEECSLIHQFDDPELGVDFLKFLRKRKGQ